MSTQDMSLTAEASYIVRYLKRMSRGKLIFLRLPRFDIELTRKSAHDYLCALGEQSVLLEVGGERVTIDGEWNEPKRPRPRHDA